MEVFNGLKQQASYRRMPQETSLNKKTCIVQGKKKIISLFWVLHSTRVAMSTNPSSLYLNLGPTQRNSAICWLYILSATSHRISILPIYYNTKLPRQCDVPGTATLRERQQGFFTCSVIAHPVKQTNRLLGSWILLIKAVCILIHRWWFDPNESVIKMYSHCHLKQEHFHKRMCQRCICVIRKDFNMWLKPHPSYGELLSAHVAVKNCGSKKKKKKIMEAKTEVYSCQKARKTAGSAFIGVQHSSMLSLINTLKLRFKNKEHDHGG